VEDVGRTLGVVIAAAMVARLVATVRAASALMWGRSSAYTRAE